MAKYKQGLMKEFTKLTRKLSKLTAFTVSSKFHHLSWNSQALLLQQRAVMREYASVLAERISRSS